MTQRKLLSRTCAWIHGGMSTEAVCIMCMGCTPDAQHISHVIQAVHARVQELGLEPRRRSSCWWPRDWRPLGSILRLHDTVGVVHVLQNGRSITIVQCTTCMEFGAETLTMHAESQLTSLTMSMLPLRPLSSNEYDIAAPPRTSQLPRCTTLELHAS